MAAAEDSDEVIVARVLSGDEGAFHVLVDRHQGPLLGAIRTRLAAQEEVREVFQETWVRALEGLASLRDPRRLRSWLVTIALNRCREGGRARRDLSLEAALADGDAGPADGAPPALEALERDEELEVLRAGIAALPERQRQVVELRVHADLSHAEIAGTLGITEENARANLYQGLKRLRAHLRGPDDTP